MKKMPDSETENLLESITPKTAPEGLRERVLEAAARGRTAGSATTPLLRIWLAGCAVVLLIVSAVDTLASRNESRRLAAMLRAPMLNHESLEPGEDCADPVLDQLEVNHTLLLADRRGERRKYRDILKIEKRLLLEEFNGN